MSVFYNSLKERMQGTLARRKDDSVPLTAVNSANALKLNSEMETLEKVVVERIARLKEAVKRGEAIILEESRQAKQLADDLKAEIAVLKATVEEAEKASQRKDLSHAKIEENLSAEIESLKYELKRKGETLTTRDNEINDYKSKMDEKVKRIGELELANTKIEEQASRHAKRAEDLANIKITALESQLKKAADIARQQESTIEALERQLVAKTQGLESMLQGKQELLTHRDSEITDLKSQLKRFKKSIDEISYLFREADPEEQDVPTAAQNSSWKTPEGEAAATEPNDGKITAPSSDAIPDLVSPEIFQRIISELSQAANVIPAVASVVVHQQARSLGESAEKFPTARLPELLEALAQEITDEDVQLDFRERFTNSTSNLSGFS